jgi:hypothetical protein
MGDILGGIFFFIILYFIGVGAYHGAHALGYAWYDPDTYNETITLYLTLFGGSIIGIFATIQIPVWFCQARSSVVSQIQRRKQAKFKAQEQAQKEAAISDAIQASESAKNTSHQQSQFQKLSLSITSLHEVSIGLLEDDTEAHLRDLSNMNDIVSDIIRDDQLSALAHATPDQVEDVAFHIEDIWENLGDSYQSSPFGRRFDRLVRTKTGDSDAS